MYILINNPIMIYRMRKQENIWYDIATIDDLLLFDDVITTEKPQEYAHGLMCFVLDTPK